MFLGDTGNDNTLFHISDSMEALAAVRPSMFADISQARRKALAGDGRHRMVVAPTRVCRKSVSRPGYVVKVRTDPGYVVKQCPRIVMNKIFDWH